MLRSMVKDTAGQRGGRLTAWPLSPKPFTSHHTHTPNATRALDERKEASTAVCRQDLVWLCHSIWNNGLGGGQSQGWSCPRHSPYRIWNRALRGPRPTPTWFLLGCLPLPPRSKKGESSGCPLASLLCVLVEFGDCGKLGFNKHLVVAGFVVCCCC